jgi:hypothetical protein
MGAEPRLWLRFDLLLLVDRSEGSLLDLLDDRRSGMTTTGMPPLFSIARRAFRLEMELCVDVEAMLSIRASGRFPFVVGRFGASSRDSGL